ncbi:MAG: serine hydrolase [Oligoflexia bacterium]|nr:serine hydrolase [Oligoflexia bacterium]MBF0367244.1 serine hydrolase [Oligoflexia bacterium]
MKLKEMPRLFLTLVFIFSVTSTSMALAMASETLCENFGDQLLKVSDTFKGGTDTFAVATDNDLLYEWYDEFHNEQSKHCLWSATKTVTAILVGVAILQEKISLDTKVEQIIPFNRTIAPNQKNYALNYSKLTIRDLLTMSSGFAWNESVGDKLWDSSILKMLYMGHMQDVASSVLATPFYEEREAKSWNYSTGDFVLLSLILKTIYKDQPRYPWDLLFDRLQMKNVTFEQDESGTYLGGSHLFLTTRDLIKIGQLLLNRGVWKGARIFPAWWIDFMANVSPGVWKMSRHSELLKDEWKNGVYGGGIWTNKSMPAITPLLPSMPDSTFLAIGVFGQYIVVSPEDRLVVVRTGHDQVSGVPLQECKKRSIFPPAISKIIKMVKISNYSRGESRPLYRLEIAPTVLSYLTVVAKSPAAYASYDPEHPERGCTLD